MTYKLRKHEDIKIQKEYFFREIIFYHTNFVQISLNYHATFYLPLITQSSIF